MFTFTSTNLIANKSKDMKINNEQKVNALLFIKPKEGEDKIKAFTEIYSETEEDWAKYQEFLGIETEAPTVSEKYWEKYLSLIERLKKAYKNMNDEQVLKNLIDIKNLVNEIFKLSSDSEHQWYYAIETHKRNYERPYYKDSDEGLIGFFGYK